MIPILFKSINWDNLASDILTNGNGPIDVTSAIISEELNGVYNAELTVPITGNNASNIEVGDFIKIGTPKDKENGDFFKVAKLKKNINGVLNVYCEHISYALNYVGVYPFTEVYSLTDAIASMYGHLMDNTPFDVSGTSPDPFGFELEKPTTVRGVIGGGDNNLLERYSVEAEWYLTNVTLSPCRGEDKGYVIEYGLNLIDYNQESNIEKMVDIFTGYAVNESDVLVYRTRQIASIVPTYPRNALVDLQSEIDNSSTVPFDTQLSQAVDRYIYHNNIAEPLVEIQLNHVHLSDTDQYSNLKLDDLYLGDVVTINFHKIGVNGVKRRMIQYNWDVLNERYTSIQIGEHKQNIEESIAQYVRK